jgi:hypothetical protein
MIRFACVAIACVLAAACASAPPATEKVALPQAPRPGEPAGIAGLSTADIRANFGNPAFVRRDGIAELWRYDGQSCKAFFFFYPEGAAVKVRHVETVPRAAGATAADPACLEALLKRRAPQPVS